MTSIRTASRTNGSTKSISIMLSCTSALLLIHRFVIVEAFVPIAPIAHRIQIHRDPSSLIVRYPDNENQNHINFQTRLNVFSDNKNSATDPSQGSRSTNEQDDASILSSIRNDLATAQFDPLGFASTTTTTTTTPTTFPEEEDEPKLTVWAARGLLLAVAVLWGTNFASVKYLENLCFHPPCVHPPSEAALARFGVAAAASLPFLINQRKDIILAGFECGLWITLGYFTQALALSSVSAAKCAFICSLTVVVVPLISALFFGKPIKPVNLVSGALAIAGVGVLEGVVDFHSLFNLQPAAVAVADATTKVITSGGAATTAGAVADHVVSTSSNMMNNAPAAAAAAAKTGGIFANIQSALGVSKGDLLALGQPFGFGLAFMRIEHYVEKFKNVDNRIMTLSAAQCVAVGMLSLFWVLFDFHGSIPNMQYMIEPHRLGAIAWTGIMTTVVAIYLEGFALQVVTATEAALTFASEPVWASLFGAWLLHEQLNINSYVGGGIILGACVLSALSDGESEEEGSNNSSGDGDKDDVIDVISSEA